MDCVFEEPKKAVRLDEMTSASKMVRSFVGSLGHCSRFRKVKGTGYRKTFVAVWLQ